MPVSPKNPLAPRPTTGHIVTQHISQWVTSSREYAARASSRTSLSTLTRPKRSHSRPSISAPTNFRHCDGFDSVEFMVAEAPSSTRRRSFRPLQLSMYGYDGCGRLSPLPDFEREDDWTSKPSPLSMPAPARVRGDEIATKPYLSSNPSSYSIPRKPVGSGSRRSSVQSVQSIGAHERRFSGSTVGTTATPALPSWDEEPKASVESFVRGPGLLRRTRTSGTNTPARVLSRLPSPSRTRANTAPTRPSSLRRANNDVDEAIRELNTIVEERRASTYRSQVQTPSLSTRIPPSPSHHVPHFAPTMRMHVRSETLSDIGSAFSVPLNKPLPTPPSSSTPALRRAPNFSLYPPARNFTGPLTSNPITPPPPKTASSTSTTSLHRLSNWLRRSSSRSTTPRELTPFYKVEGPPVPDLASCPSTSRSTTGHGRQDSADSNDSARTAATTVTLVSSYTSTRSTTPDSEDASERATHPHPRVTVLKGTGRLRRVPAPLVLATIDDKDIEAALGSERSTRSARGMREMWPPASPVYDILPGQEMFAKDVGMAMHSGRRFPPSPMGMVGVAF
ncbi:uncharacterized protein M421DRAFT_103491 [Didymella exigua CBS 183.55]|uniref:Uncharacterized protein n=1 Tax=Didymella exigua CBS 183.55 TaxID=1150837 RepID=A0A6A5R9Q9_9PLEO|nr:uncharacterized protein M421DRAFT_103491 [Didymella exigua CBS 183.55]KAF1924951.1 hypothetical protein M421DRAFT_103491 [Didymella exigua CBS 183.55]